MTGTGLLWLTGRAHAASVPWLFARVQISENVLDPDHLLSAFETVPRNRAKGEDEDQEQCILDMSLYADLQVKLGLNCTSSRAVLEDGDRSLLYSLGTAEGFQVRIATAVDA